MYGTITQSFYRPKLLKKVEIKESNISSLHLKLVFAYKIHLSDNKTAKQHIQSYKR